MIHERGFSRVMVSTLDVPGLFSMIAGVMAANGINILGAQIYTRSNGAALDILHVNNPAGRGDREPGQVGAGSARSCRG
ncbi:MAG: hypothetical protein M0C28_37135 [Candidatus Moduliflexus flocculans]|nr:hypothetical protein [Candidatus Moduliflexus flocculans]